MKNINFKVLNEGFKKQKYYALVKASVEEKDSYFVLVQDEDLIIQGVGQDLVRGEKIYRMLLRGEVSSIHADEVIRDLQNEIFAWSYLLFAHFMI